MSEKMREWQEVSAALDSLAANATEISSYLATRHPEEGGILVYTELEHMLGRRDTAISALKSAQKGVIPLSPPEDEEEAALRRQVDEKIEKILSLDTKNNARMKELGDFYTDKLKANKQSRETLSAYSQQMHVAAELNAGNLFNEAK